ncbi:MAG: iron ABC transporter permease [Nitrospinota bacterium]|nr:iron ABC transporter permease [Nitrospinota bacterium]MDP7370724.1 iron ABC transporter permease [Nitrospinota bacterium]MDP7661831.1 iron ABC transporter permease [Nitrospinota bacterium]
MSAATDSSPLPARPMRWVRADVWTIGTVFFAAVIAAPILTVLILAVSSSGDIWNHLASTVLPRYIRTTLGLMAGAGAGTAVIGVASAWLVTLCRFPGRRVFEWALLLPMAMPAYVVAYVYTDILEYAGPVQELLRQVFGWSSGRDYWFPEIRSLGGAAAMMTLVLYPYVYLLARIAFLQQSACVLEASRTLGLGPWRSFFSVALPLARPSIVIGVSLVLMESLNDFGTVDFFSVETLTAGIYDVWLNMNNTAGAAQLATVSLAFVLALIGAEKWSRRSQRFYTTSSKYRPLPNYRLKGSRAAIAFAVCLLPVAFGFLVPAGVLLNYAARFYEESLSANFLTYAGNSLMLSSISAALAALLGLFMAYGVRINGSPLLVAASRLASIGYAVPGAVLAVGVMIPLARADAAIDGLMRNLFGIPARLLLSGTIVAVTYGYLVRFLTLSYGTAESSLAKITPNMDDASRTLGMSPGRTLRRVHFPLIRGSVLAAAILVFVDCMKELPMTIILRPFNYGTLATQVHQFASDELLEESALGALAIVAAGILPVIILSATIHDTRPGHSGAKG